MVALINHFLLLLGEFRAHSRPPSWSRFPGEPWSRFLPSPPSRGDGCDRCECLMSALTPPFVRLLSPPELEVARMSTDGNLPDLKFPQTGGQGNAIRLSASTLKQHGRNGERRCPDAPSFSSPEALPGRRRRRSDMT